MHIYTYVCINSFISFYIKVTETLALANAQKPLIGSFLTENFRIRRPRGLQVSWDTIIQMHTVMFEVELLRGQQNKAPSEPQQNGDIDLEEQKEAEKEANLAKDRRESQALKSILLKGQMYFLEELGVLIFLCCPV